jgi:HSP20 family protein
MFDTVENWFRGVPVWLPDPERRAPKQTQFRMDVSENEKEYRVLAELPDVKKEEISITINGNEVAVAAEVKHEKDVKNGETVLCAERYYGRIQRAFTLGHEVDEASAQGQVQRWRAGAHAAEESRSRREKARGALSGASNSTSRVVNIQTPRQRGFCC